MTAAHLRVAVPPQAPSEIDTAGLLLAAIADLAAADRAKLAGLVDAADLPRPSDQAIFRGLQHSPVRGTGAFHWLNGEFQRRGSYQDPGGRELRHRLLEVVSLEGHRDQAPVLAQVVVADALRRTMAEHARRLLEIAEDGSEHDLAVAALDVETVFRAIADRLSKLRGDGTE